MIVLDEKKIEHIADELTHIGGQLGEIQSRACLARDDALAALSIELANSLEDVRHQVEDLAGAGKAPCLDPEDWELELEAPAMPEPRSFPVTIIVESVSRGTTRPLDETDLGW